MTRLTETELEVLRRAASGQTYAVIARELGYQEKSVSKMALRLARKLDANNITHAVLLACRAGLIDGRPQRHGDHAGYIAHKRRCEIPCDDCVAGELAYQTGRREIRRQQRATGQPAPQKTAA